MKVLIVSHPPVTTHEAMGKTFLSLFIKFKKEELCQFYIGPNIPDIDFCNSYFRITDKDVLKSYFKFKVKSKKISIQEINNSNSILFESEKDELFYKNKKNKTSFRILLRDLMWKFSHWYTKELKEWVKEEEPTHIFVAPGNAKLIYDVAIKLSKELKLPIITYICDEFYFVNNVNTLLDKLRLKLIRNKMHQLMDRTSHIVTICDRLNELYSKEFDKPTTTIMTGASFDTTEKKVDIIKLKALYYFGNIICNRYISLADIGRVLKRINFENNTDFVLKIYTNVKDRELLNYLSEIDTIRYCGHITGDEFYKVFHSADILVHTEAFDKESVDLVKNSVSTKIADSLASGIPLFAYGPAKVASMKHLIDNNCAITATSDDELYDALKSVFFDSDLRKKVVANALETAERYHNSKINSNSLYDLINLL